MGDRNYSFDANLLLADGVAAITVDGYSQNAGADGIIDFGGNQSVTPAQQARIDCMLVIDVQALEIDSSNELYRLKVLGCNVSSFASGVKVLSEMTLGKGSAKVPTTGADDTPGRYELPFCTEQDDVKYQYVKLYVDVAGTIVTGIDFTAFVAVLPEP